MPLFPSDEWMDAFCRAVADQPDATRLAPALEGVYRFVVEPAGALEQTRSYDVEIRPGPDGDGLVARRLDTAAEQPRLVLTANYERWRQLLTGRLDIGMAVMLRRLKISGDLGALMRDVGSAKPLMDALREVDSVWLGG